MGITACMAAIPNNHRLDPRTAVFQQSIWRITGEDTFRRNVVRLAKACYGVGWTTDVVFKTTRSITSKAVVPDWSTESASNYRLPLAVEDRLSNDLAFIAAVQEGVHSVTAACIEEHNSSADTGLKLKLCIAANGGIPDCVQTALEDIWWTIQKGTGQAETSFKNLQDSVFAKVVRINGMRILQRIRNALGYPPGFLPPKPIEAVAGTNRLKLAIELMRQRGRLTAFGRSFVADLTRLEGEFRAISDKWAPGDATQSHCDAVVESLQVVSEQAFLLTTTGPGGGGVLFGEVLQQAGLDVRLCLENKHLAEIEKIGAYRRVAKSLVRTYREISNASATMKVELEIVALLPYRPVQSEISCKASRRKPHVDCFVHAEIQLLCHYALEQPTAERRLPRVMGASKLSCFLCFLCISCYGGLKPPLPHGQIFDQWTMPDLHQFDKQAANKLRQTVVLMNATVLRLLKKKYSPKNFPLTSRVHIDEVPVSSVEVMHSPPPGTTEMSGIPSTTATADLTTGADRAVGLNGSSGPRSSASPVTSRSWLDGQCVAISAVKQRFVLRQMPKVKLLIEAEAPCTGQAQLERLTLSEGKPEATASITLDELLPGEDYVFSRKSEQPQLVLDLKLADESDLHRLSLRWIEQKSS